MRRLQNILSKSAILTNAVQDLMMMPTLDLPTGALYKA
jgi:hypothetical protein